MPASRISSTAPPAWFVGPGSVACEKFVFAQHPTSGLRAVIAIHSTVLGPALGGVRRYAYASDADGVREASRLALAMTCKNALAGIPYGGGKAVIFDDGEIHDRRPLMRAFGRVVATTPDYVPGVDMGTTGEDLTIIGEGGTRVSCADVDPSPYTAYSAMAAIDAAASDTLCRSDPEGIRVLIQGLGGRVGSILARLLAARGALILGADTDIQLARRVADEVGGDVVAPDDVLTTPCDIFVPAAVAGS